MKNKILLEKIYQVVSKCTTSPIYQNLRHNKKYNDSTQSEVIGESYSVLINNNQVLMELSNNSNSSNNPNQVKSAVTGNFPYEFSLQMNIVANKILKPYKRFNKFRKPRYEYSIILNPLDISQNQNFGNNVHISPGNTPDSEIKFTDDELCKKFYEAMEKLFYFTKDTKSTQIIKGLDKIIEHNKQAKREIGLESIMDDE
jgi:hypothetical protein